VLVGKSKLNILGRLAFFYEYLGMDRFFGVVVAILLITVQVQAQSNRRFTRAYRDSVLQTYAGTTYPDYKLLLSDNKWADSKGNKGKVVFVNIWFGGCPACITEFGALNELYDSLKNNPNIVFLSVASEPMNRVLVLQSRYHITYPVASASPDICSKLNYNQGFPANIIIGPNGKIAVFKLEGYSEKRAREVMIGQWLPMMRRMAAH
jgi:thiol-disulfide isomerase/thioredoxin